MESVLIQGKLTENEVGQLQKEFPQFNFLLYTELTYKNLTPEEWRNVKIVYGNRLTPQELEMAEKLRWIHSPSPELNTLFLKEMHDLETVIMTTTEEENTTQITEFVFAAILAYSKNLFHWKDVDSKPSLLWDSKWRDQMTTLDKKTFIQIGLSRVGKEIAKKAKEMGMKVIGFDEKPTFNPYCHEIYSTKELRTHLSRGDVINVSLPHEKQKPNLLKRTELEMMKDDAILSLLGSSDQVDETALHKLATGGKFRGIVLDARYLTPISSTSLLWEIPNMLITPEVASRPRAENVASLRNFRYNMRQFLHKNFSDMRHVVK